MTSLIFLGACLLVVVAIVVAALRAVRLERLAPAVLLIATAPLEVYRAGVGPFNISLFRLALALVCILILWDLAHGRIGTLRPQHRPVVFAVYLLLLAWQLISLAFVSTEPSLGYRFLSQYGAGLAAAFLITCYVRRSDVIAIAVAYVASAAIPLVASTYRIFSVELEGSGDLPGFALLSIDPAIGAVRDNDSVLFDGVQRMQGTFTDPNHFAFFVATALIVSLGLVVYATSKQPHPALPALLAAVLSAAVLLIGVVGSYSRSSWILTCVGALVLIALLGRRVWTVRRLMAAIGLGVVLAGAVGPIVLDRVDSNSPGTQVSNQAHERTVRRAADLAAEHPLTGVGLGAYGEHANQPRLVSSSHSTVMTVTAELGFPGTALFLTVIALTLLGGVRSARALGLPDRACAAGFLAAFAGLAIANVFYEVWMDDFQWVLFGCVLALLRPLELPRGLLFRSRGRGAFLIPNADAPR